MSGPKTGPRPASSTPTMYGPGAVGVGEWYVYESVSGVEGPGADRTRSEQDMTREDLNNYY